MEPWTSRRFAVEPVFLFSPFPLGLTICCSGAQYFSSFGLLHADGKLCVYFKNRFATLHIPALNPACRCPATLTGTLLSGAEARGCGLQTRPLEIIISLVPESITGIQWSARPLETQVHVFPFSVLSSLESYSSSVVLWLHIQFHSKLSLGNHELLQYKRTETTKLISKWYQI